MKDSLTNAIVGELGNFNPTYEGQLEMIGYVKEITDFVRIASVGSGFWVHRVLV